MPTPLRVLIVEDSEDDCLVAMDELRRSGFDVSWRRVEIAETMQSALDSETWDVILCDYTLPHFTGPEALTLLTASGLDIPLILVSGTIAQEAAVEALTRGARDFVFKEKLSKLGPVVDRELKAADDRRKHRDAEAALRESERKYRSLVEQASDGIAIFDDSDRLVEANTAMVTMLNFSIDEARNRSLAEFIAPETHEGQALRPAARPGEATYVRAVLVRKGGKRFPADITTTRLDDGRLLVVVRDVTATIAAEEALRRSEFTMAEAQRIAHIGSWCWHVAQDRFDGSDETYRILGLDPQSESPDTQRVIDLVAPESRDTLRSVMGELAAGRSAEADLVLLNPDGVRRWAHTQGEPESEAAADQLDVFGYLQDITERKNTEEEVRRREAEFKALIEAAPDIISRLDRYGRLAYASPAIDITGIPAAQWIGKTNHDLGMPETVCAALQQGIDHVFETATRTAFEFNFPGRDGEMTVEIHMAPQFGSDGAVEYAVSVARDVTAFRAAEQRLRDLVASASDAILVVGLDGTALQVNAAVERMVGAPVEILIGQHITDHIHPEDRERVARALAEVIVTGQLSHIEARVRNISGEFVHIDATASRQPGVDGGAIFIIARDVTERRRSEAEREALHRDVQLLLESTYEGIYTIDQEGRCTLVNRAACAMLGYSASELLGKDLHEVFHNRRADGRPYPASDCPIRIQLQTAKPRQVIDELVWRKDGTSFPVEIMISPILDGERGTKGLVVSFTDVTEKRLLHDELERANRLSSLGRVAATMSHEFNNVLMGIQPFAELLVRRGGDDRVIDAATHILQSVRRGRSVTQELLRFTRPAAPARRVVDVASLLRDCASEMQPLMTPSVHLAVSLSDDPLAIAADGEQIAQVLSNLIINARDATIAAGGHITVGATRCAQDEMFAFGVVPDAHLHAHFFVTDDGPGVAAAHLPRIFEPFFTTKSKGTGLGLPTAHQIISLHGGHLFIESVVGAGTTVHFFLPLSATAEQIVEQKTLPHEHGGRPRRVLLVEDEESVSSGMSMLLEAEGIHVDVAATGAAALECIDRCEPDVVILDVGLPDMNGLEVYKRLRIKHAQVPVVFSSGHASGNRIDELPDPHNVRLLTKPYAFEDLLAMLEEVFIAPSAS